MYESRKSTELRFNWRLQSCNFKPF